VLIYLTLTICALPLTLQVITSIYFKLIWYLTSVGVKYVNIFTFFNTLNFQFQKKKNTISLLWELFYNGQYKLKKYILWTFLLPHPYVLLEKFSMGRLIKKKGAEFPFVPSQFDHCLCADTCNQYTYFYNRM